MTEFSETASSAHPELIPMREVVRQTGVNPVTLRAWERRYGLICPVRTEGGHRLYSREDVDAIRRILTWTGRGVAVSKVGELLASQRDRAPESAAAQHGEADERQHWRASFLAAVSRFDSTELERLYGQLFTLYPPAVVFESVLLPLWRDLLQRSDFGATSQWLFLDAFLRARVLMRLQMNRASGAPVLLAALPGGCRELELLCVGLLLGGEDLRVEVLAPGQPLNELSLVCEARQPQALVLLAQAPLDAEQLRRVHRLQLGLDCLLALAGEAAEIGLEGVQQSPIACLGGGAASMGRRLRAFIDGRLDT